MLVLGRKPNEQIIVGDLVRITILEISGTQVRLGFEASTEVTILREELLPRSAQPAEVERQSLGSLDPDST